MHTISAGRLFLRPVPPRPGHDAGSAHASPPLTTPASGVSASDAAQVEQAFQLLRSTQMGAFVVDRLQQVGARVSVASDAEFTQLGQAGAHACFDPRGRTIYLRRSDLQDPRRLGFAAVALAHEATHLLDRAHDLDAARVRSTTEQIRAAGGLATATGAEAARRSDFELTMIRETRAYVCAGRVARELGLQLDAADPTSIAAAAADAGAGAGYARVWQALLRSDYNPELRHASPRTY